MELTTTCYAGFHALVGAKCTQHVSSTLPVLVHNCVRNGASGALVLQRTNESAMPVNELLGTAMYRLRVMGRDGLWLLDVAYCQPGLAVAPYTLPGAGRYFIEVLMLYTSFSFAAPNTSRAIPAPWAGFLTLDVSASEPATPTNANAVTQIWTPVPLDASALGQSWTAVPAARPGTLTDLPLCADTGPLPGRWRFRYWPPAAGAAAAAAAALRRTCIFNDSAHDCRSPDREPLHYASFPATLHWQPDGCRMRAIAAISVPPPVVLPVADDVDSGGVSTAADPATVAVPWDEYPLRDTVDIGVAGVQPSSSSSSWSSSSRRGPSLAEPVVEPSTCLPPGRVVCFIGDSHSRYLHNSLVLWRSGYRRTVNNTDKETLSSSSSRYFRMVFGYDWPPPDADGVDPLVAACCTDVVANFGQWPASYRAGPAPFSAGQYLQQLLAVRHRLLALRRTRGVRVWWLTTCSPSLKAWLESAGVDWRTDPMLMLYNRLAADVMRGALAPAAEVAMEAAPDSGGRIGGTRHLGGVPEVLAPAPTPVAAAAAPAAGGGGGLNASAAAEQMLRWSWRVEDRRRRARARVLQRRRMVAQRRGRELPLPRATVPSPPVPSTVANADSARRSLPQLQGSGSAAAAAAGGGGTSASWGRGAPFGSAGRMMTERGDDAIPLIDTWSAAAVLIEGTWDGVHFTNKGAVGLAQLTSVLHAICSEQTLREVAAAGR